MGHSAEVSRGTVMGQPSWDSPVPYGIQNPMTITPSQLGVMVFGSTAKAGYFIDRIPGVMRKVVGKSSLGDQNMDWWRTHSAYKKPANSGFAADWARYVVDFDELRKWKNSTECGGYPPNFAKNWAHPTASEDLDNFGTFTKMMYRDYKAKGVSPSGWTFPDPPIPETPGAIGDASRNDRDWADRLEKERIGLKGDGTIMVSPDDPFSLAIGRFNWCFFPVGSAQRAATPEVPNRYIVTVRQVGVYAIDKYDFTNEGRYDQYLGDWNVDTGDEGLRGTVATGIDFAANWVGSNLSISSTLSRDAGYYPKMGYKTVSNNAFDRYRTETGRGCDFMVLSNVKYFDLNESFDFNMDKLGP
jgi:hypothetical protein